jgi:hypothetical protein
LALLLFSAASVSASVIFANRESRELLKDCKNRIF